MRGAPQIKEKACEVGKLVVVTVAPGLLLESKGLCYYYVIYSLIFTFCAFGRGMAPGKFLLWRKSGCEDGRCPPHSGGVCVWFVLGALCPMPPHPQGDQPKHEDGPGVATSPLFHDTLEMRAFNGKFINC